MIKTYLPSNLARIICPIFGAEVELRGCLALRDKLWRGERQPVRQGCQACMQASKCPIVPMVQIIQRTGTDPYFSAEAKTVRLGAEILKRIVAVIVPDAIMRIFDIPERQRELILETNGLNGSSKLRTGGVELDLPEGASYEPAPRRKAALKPKPEADLIAAATSGDMGAAINIAVADAA